MHHVKPVIWVGNSKEDLMAFPATARREAGFQLDKVQHGHDPDNWKPMHTIGPGVREIRIGDTAGAFRVIYVATFPDAVCVLHAFQKKTDKTSLNDLRLAQQRFKTLTR
jgi:phage-related protein